MLPVTQAEDSGSLFSSFLPYPSFICFAKLHIELDSSRLVCKCPRQGKQMTGGFS